MSKGWPIVPLREVLTLYGDYIEAPEPKTYPKLSVKLYGKGVVLDTPADGASLKMKRHQIAKAGQVILSEIWGKKGAIGFVPPGGEGALCTSHFFLFDVLEDRIEPKYLQAIFTANYLQEQLDAEAQGTTGYAAVRPAYLLAAKIPLPPISEQQRVVARIEELAGKIQEARGLRLVGDQESDALLSRILEHSRNRLLDSAYPAMELGKLTRITSGGTPARDNPAYWNGEIPWVKTGELLDGDISAAEEKITDDGMQNSSAKLFPPETVVVALYGQGQTRGRTGRLVIPATTNQACAAILPCEKLGSRYVQYWVRSLYRELREQTHGGAQPNWNGQMIKSIRIAIPPLMEQRRIVAYLDGLQAKVDALKRLQAETAAELDTLLPAILDRAFKGEL